MHYRHLTCADLATLNAAAMNGGDMVTTVAYEALYNAAGAVGLCSPRSQSAMVLPEGLTRYTADGTGVEFCYRADLAEGVQAPRRGSSTRLAQDFNGVAAYYGLPVRFKVRLYPYQGRQVIVAAQPLFWGGTN